MAKEGAVIDRFYYCPHHVDGVIEEYTKDCYCRKPNPGMIEKAVRDFDIDLKKSFIIGDNASDIEAGHRAGCRSIFLGYEDRLEEKSTVPAAQIVPDLRKAVEWLLENDRNLSN